ncbi:MAG: hypothetical protein IT425_00705 [Pirellulales bacterium]|nr:hypothetical protein [Pirellulales bacterium]
MKRYTVTWDKDVEESFIENWMTAAPEVRKHLTEMADWVDENLAVAPNKLGHLRLDQVSRIAVVPISSEVAWASVTYRVSEEDCVVRVVCLLYRRMEVR